MDPKANGQLQTHWRWLVAVYLFLGGVGAGAYTIAAINGFLGKELELSSRVGLWIGFPALVIGSLCLMADLGSPTKAIFAGLKVGSSWIARGFWIISAFMLLSLIHLVAFQQGHRLATSSWLAVVAVLGILTAVGTMAYTGLLLGASKGIPFWRTGMVPVVFVISALVTGHCVIMLGMVLFSEGPTTATAFRVMGIEAAVLIALEALAIALYLYSAFKLAEARESARRILANTAFVFGYFLLGLAVPFVLSLYLGFGSGGASVAVTAIAAVLGLAGGLILRWAVLSVGTMPSWRVGGFEFRRISRPKPVKPGIGMMPPS